MDYLPLFPKTARRDKILALRKKRLEWAEQEKKGFLRYRKPCERLVSFRANYIDCSSDVVTIGSNDEITDVQKKTIEDDLRAFMPWRKGPFSIFGIDVDAEWRSERKWQRILPVLPDLKDTIIADIGCNNGYYMFRMTPFQPKLVLGLEPTIQHYYCFKALNGMARFSNLYIDLLGVEHLSLFPTCFDVIFLMGIIYHRPSPLDVLKDVHTALLPGGTLILESQAIPGHESMALFPERTYAKVPGTYFVPTGTCLYHWMQRVGFTDVKLFYSHPMSSAEQRRTDWMIFESFSDFLSPGNPALTVEGYPAPHRVFLIGRK
jgi:tRNA (mo5U34)-methyltransferase